VSAGVRFAALESRRTPTGNGGALLPLIVDREVSTAASVTSGRGVTSPPMTAYGVGSNNPPPPPTNLISTPSPLQSPHEQSPHETSVSTANQPTTTATHHTMSSNPQSATEGRQSPPSEKQSDRQIGQQSAAGKGEGDTQRGGGSEKGDDLQKRAGDRQVADLESNPKGPLEDAAKGKRG